MDSGTDGTNQPEAQWRTRTRPTLERPATSGAANANQSRSRGGPTTGPPTPPSALAAPRMNSRTDTAIGPSTTKAR